jgi:hypothetical protein
MKKRPCCLVEHIAGNCGQLRCGSIALLTHDPEKWTSASEKNRAVKGEQNKTKYSEAIFDKIIDYRS